MKSGDCKGHFEHTLYVCACVMLFVKYLPMDSYINLAPYSERPYHWHCSLSNILWENILDPKDTHVFSAFTCCLGSIKGLIFKLV